MFYLRFFLSAITSGMVLTACSNSGDNTADSKMTPKNIAKIMPRHGQDRTLWAQDIFDITKNLGIEQNKESICAITAIIDQESGFNADPAVPNLGKHALDELTERLNRKLGTLIAGQFLHMLETKPTPTNNFKKQLLQVKTEHELDLLFRDMFNYFKKEYNLTLITGAASILAGQSISEKLNPVKTIGSMQVHINYVLDHAKELSGTEKLRDSVYTRDGGLYYGIHRLMMYQTKYDKPIYRFADYNSGMFSSRNAATQLWINKLAQKKKLTIEPLVADGDFLLYDKDEDVQNQTSNSEKNIKAVFDAYKVALASVQIRNDLEKEKKQSFEETKTYLELQQLYQSTFNRKPDYATMPQVQITGPKISRSLNTNWYASGVNKRYLSCIYKAKIYHIK